MITNVRKEVTTTTSTALIYRSSLSVAPLCLRLFLILNIYERNGKPKIEQRGIDTKSHASLARAPKSRSKEDI